MHVSCHGVILVPVLLWLFTYYEKLQGIFNARDYDIQKQPPVKCF